MILGTHNSLTSYPMIGWCKFFKPILDIFCRCQDRTLEEQWNSGVRVFNLQIAKRRNQWKGSHGIAWYNIDVHKALRILNDLSKKSGEDVYVQLALDNHFGTSQSELEFLGLVELLKKDYPRVTIITIALEKSGKYNQIKNIGLEEHYWTKSWSIGRSWYEKLPLPRWNAKKYNKGYKEKYKNSNFLMLDFYEI